MTAINLSTDSFDDGDDGDDDSVEDDSAEEDSSATIPSGTRELTALVKV